eukprot:g21873.t1
MIAIAGSSARLRPHCKTHKTREVVELQIAKGINKHKCATFAEAEMLADIGVKDVFLAYSLVGPNIDRAVEFCRRFPDVTLSVTADHDAPITALGRAMQSAGQMVDVLLDIDTGQHRTGIPVGSRAAELYRQIHETNRLNVGGLHLYDGQNHQTPLDERRDAVTKCWQEVAGFRDELVAADLPVPRIVAGGTGSFPIYAEIDDPAIELSPGTCIYHDAGYGAMFPDLEFTPAAMLLTRVISRPTDDRITVDLGYKAVASDPAMPMRAVFPDLPDAELVLQNEEHLVLKTSRAGDYQPGDELYAIPRHVCPTSAMHKEALMELGSQICRPVEPDCEACPVKSHCRAFREQTVAAIPVAKNRPKTTHITEATIAIEKEGRFLLKQNTTEERWAGLWDFPRFEMEANVADELDPKGLQMVSAIAETAQRDLTGICAAVEQLRTEMRHSVTRYRIRLLCFRGRYRRGEFTADTAHRWVAPGEFPDLPLSVTGRKFANLITKDESP